MRDTTHLRFCPRSKQRARRHLNLRRRLADRRIGKVENLTKNVVFHHYFVSSMPDLDEEVGQ